MLDISFPKMSQEVFLFAYSAFIRSQLEYYVQALLPLIKQMMRKI